MSTRMVDNFFSRAIILVFVLYFVYKCKPLNVFSIRKSWLRTFLNELTDRHIAQLLTEFRNKQNNRKIKTHKAKRV